MLDEMASTAAQNFIKPSGISVPYQGIQDTFILNIFSSAEKILWVVTGSSRDIQSKYLYYSFSTSFIDLSTSLTLRVKQYRQTSSKMSVSIFNTLEIEQVTNSARLQFFNIKSDVK
jgi:hypothetical protein